MIVVFELGAPNAPAPDFREAVMARAPLAGEKACPACGVDRFHLMDALCDPDCWENRSLAASLVHGCRTCRREIAEVLAEARSALVADQEVDVDLSFGRIGSRDPRRASG